MPQIILGIDIGSYSVKIAEIERSFKSFEFVAFYERVIQYNDLLSPEESRAIALQGLMDDNNITCDFCYSAISAQRVSSRLVTFPFSSSKKIAQTLPFEIESYVPFDVNDLIIDHSVLWSTKEATRVIACYVQREEFKKHLHLLQHVGLEPRTVSSEALDYVSIMNLGLVPPEGAYAIIDIGHEKTNIALCSGKRLGYVRAVSIAGKSITQRIADALQISFEEAERIKIEMGRLPNEFEDEELDDITSAVQKSIKSVIDELLLHIRQTLFTFRDLESISVEGVYLSGGSSRLPGLESYLSGELKQNITYVNCSDFHFSKLEHAEVHRHVIPQALALALKGVAAGAPDINFRQGEDAFKGDVEEIGGSLKYLVAACVLIISLALTYFSISYYHLKGESERMKRDMEEVIKQALPDAPPQAFKTQKGALSLLTSKEQQVEERKKEIESLQGVSPLDIFKEISQILPAREELTLDVEKISVAKDRAQFTGVTDSFESVDKIRDSLGKSPMFKNVEIGNRNKGAKGEIKFSIALDFKKDGEESS
ncbi:MAG: hypothetical protein COX62_02210 [Deltaproteobacteria bacterium CG_4_10_14_0_2_um_filter_43_8]|nr:MAG: hypothetical protein COV43_01890 [Deltaproteobacteria bacterium CG11_big_fil_rev_8_21_14_0_20_42_23]PJA21533.1 MAG: hypothetical protein COX62_02210 [Deltaproteobacteria bacterium CG_4_10_14_0_2_um_filter_43_8]PJC63985.1 MAG: hypothetical protein CO021_06655 [Deltaproteobacteria bacterium CG_4_9_14_0_2_um_filter_42_21]